MFKQVINVFEEIRNIVFQNKGIIREYLEYTYPRKLQDIDIIDVDEESKIAVKMKVQFTIVKLEEEK